MAAILSQYCLKQSLWAPAGWEPSSDQRWEEMGIIEPNAACKYLIRNGFCGKKTLVELRGIEPLTSAVRLQATRNYPSWTKVPLAF